MRRITGKLDDIPSWNIESEKKKGGCFPSRVNNIISKVCTFPFYLQLDNQKKKKCTAPSAVKVGLGKSVAIIKIILRRVWNPYITILRRGKP